LHEASSKHGPHLRACRAVLAGTLLVNKDPVNYRAICSSHDAQTKVSLPHNFTAIKNPCKGECAAR
jgi:hypothetical protein